VAMNMNPSKDRKVVASGTSPSSCECFISAGDPAFRRLGVDRFAQAKTSSEP
jgi:hypothetical protein